MLIVSSAAYTGYSRLDNSFAWLGAPAALSVCSKSHKRGSIPGMTFSWAQEALAVLSGGAVGFSLGLIGGGGSILAVPLLLYVVGITDPHVAIGTSALSVA